MKKAFLLSVVCLLAMTSINAQKWSDLSKEQKMDKVLGFREDNQKFLKNTLKLSAVQIDDIDNVNICFLSTLDRIDRYGKTDQAKEQFAQSALTARSMQMDAIMGAENRKKYMDYVTAKLKKAAK